jgi:uncharacterized protein DUF6221
VESPVTNTADLAVWLRTALDRVEQQAKAAMAHPDDDGRWTAGEGEWQAERIDGAGITIYDEGGHTAEQAVHIAFWDPARELRLVEATRRMLALVLPEDQVDLHDDEQVFYREGMLDALRLTAMWLDDQPGFRDEWRPR